MIFNKTRIGSSAEKDGENGISNLIKSTRLMVSYQKFAKSTRKLALTILKLRFPKKGREPGKKSPTKKRLIIKCKDN